MKVRVVRCPLSVVRGKTRACRRAFSFTEVLFAIMILGIGFIMVAAMFPVAIKQTKLSLEETSAATSATAASDIMQKLTNDALMPSGALTPTELAALKAARDPVLSPLPGPPIAGLTTIPGRVWTFRDERFRDTTRFATALDPTVGWLAEGGNLIDPSDPRFAWVPMYRRDMVWSQDQQTYVQSSSAEVILMAVQVRNHSQYTLADIRRVPDLPANPPGVNPATLEPAVVSASVIQQLAMGGPQTIAFKFPTQDQANRVAEGCYAVISDDDIPASSAAPLHGLANGRIIRVGRFRPDLSKLSTATPVFEVAPGYELPTTGNDWPAYFGSASGPHVLQVLVIGRGRRNSDQTQDFDGPPQDIAPYVSYVKF